MHEIVLYKKRNFSSLGILIESSDEFVNLITEDGKILKIEKDKVIYHTKIYSQSYPNTDEVKLELRSYRKHLEDEKSSIDIKTIWECSYNTDNNSPVTLDDIINLYPDYKKDKNKLFLLVWSVERDDIYFKKDSNIYQPNTNEEIENIIKRKNEYLLKIKQKDNAKDWVKKVYNGKLEHTQDDIDKYNKYIDLIKEYAIYGDDSKRAKEAKSFIAEADIKDEYGALEFLISIGLWERENDPVYTKYGIKNNYTTKVLNETKTLIEKDLSFDRLVDITKLKIYSIDDENTTDIDDAISIENKGDNCRVGIHITNVASIIDSESHLDDEALKRGETIYVPEGNIQMFPPELVSNLLSLNEKNIRKAISLFITFDQDNQMIHHEFIQTKIKIDHNINYTDTNDLILTSNEWKRLFEITKMLKYRRINNGAIILQLPTLKITIEDSDMITINKNYMNTPAHNMVAEFMILMNTLSANYFIRNNIPALYRTQTEKVSEEINYLDYDNILFPVEAIKFLKPTKISTKPDIHRFLGVNEYVQISSPIRRYLDLVMQRQLLRSLEGRNPVYNIKQLETINTKAEMAVKEKKIIEKARERYWVLKYLKISNTNHLNGVISSVRNKRASAYFPDYLMEIPFSITSEEQMHIGNELQFAIESIDLIRKRITIKPLYV